MPLRRTDLCTAGLGGTLLMDDANVPSLLSVPYLGYAYDPAVYKRTRKFLLSRANPTFHTSSDGKVPLLTRQRHTIFRRLDQMFCCRG